MLQSFPTHFERLRIRPEKPIRCICLKILATVLGLAMVSVSAHTVNAIFKVDNP